MGNLARAVKATLIEAQERAPVLPKVPTIEHIKSLQQAIQADAIPGLRKIDELPVEHLFADGLYARKLARPKGTLIVGKMHAKRHFYVLLEGEITAWTPTGMKRMKAPQVLITEPGTKRVTYAHTDAVGITFHATQHTDLAAIEAELIIPEVDEDSVNVLALLEMEKQT